MAKKDELEHSREVAWGSFWGLVGTVALKLVSFAYAIYIARAFSQEDIGLFYLALSVIGLLTMWRDLGLPAALLRYVPYFEAKGQGGKLLSLLRISSIADAIVGLLLFVAFMALAGPIGELYGNPGLAEGIRLLAAFVLFENLYKVATGYLQGRGDIKTCQLLGNVQNVIKLAITVAMVGIYGATLFTISAAFVISYIVVAALSLPFVLRRVSDIQKSSGNVAASELVREILPFGITITIVQSLWTLISSTDRALLGYFGNSATSVETVAVYSIATQLALTVMVFPGAVGGIFLPVISRLAGKEDYAAMRSVMATSQRWMAFITIPIALATMAFAGDMLSAFYGAKYSPGGPAMAIFILGLMFSTAALPISLALAGMRLVKLELYVALAAGAANVALNLLFIPQFGMEGAAFASAIAFLLSSLMFERYGRQVLSYRTPIGIYKLFAAGAAAFLLIMLLKPFAIYVSAALPAMPPSEFSGYAAKISYLAVLAVMGCIGLAFFFAFALLLRTFKHEDVLILRSACRKARVPAGLGALAERIALLGVEDAKGQK